ncbi:MAG: hypothetical protein ACI8Y7_000186 [Candidatus Woesearchaeota archaeon]|jgi:hypothetical protein
MSEDQFSHRGRDVSELTRQISEGIYGLKSKQIVLVGHEAYLCDFAKYTASTLGIEQDMPLDIESGSGVRFSFAERTLYTLDNDNSEESGIKMEVLSDIPPKRFDIKSK